jgi:MFS family permease
LLGAALLAQTAISVVEQGLPTLAPFIKRDLELSAASVGFAVTSFNYGRVLGSYAAGRAVDALGDRRVMIGGGLGCALLTALAAPLPFAALLAVLVVAGLLAATSTPAGSSVVMTAFPPDRRALPMGVRQTGIPLGGLLAAVLLPFAAGRLGWREALAVAAAIALAGTLLALPAARGGGVGEREVQTTGRRDPAILNLAIWGSLLVCAQYSVLAFLILDVERHGISIGHAAALLAVAQAGGIAGRLVWGLLSDRALHGARRPALVAITLLAIGVSLLLAWLPGRVGFAGLLPVAFLAGVTMMGWNGLWVMAVAELAAPGRRGAEVGFGLTFVAVATVVAPPLFGLVADAGGYSMAWLALAGLLALALVPASFVRRRD